MNKYQESFERIKEECSKLHNFDIIDDFINLKKLVDKATPKKWKRLIIMNRLVTTNVQYVIR